MKMEPYQVRVRDENPHTGVPIPCSGSCYLWVRLLIFVPVWSEL